MGLAPLEVMVAWVVPYERGEECSFCSSSVEPILKRYSQYDGFSYKKSTQKMIHVLVKGTNKSLKLHLKPDQPECKSGEQQLEH